MPGMALAVIWVESGFVAPVVGGAAGVFCGKSGVVLEPAGAPVMGGAEGRPGMAPDAGLDAVGMGLVTAVDHAGLVTGTGNSICPGFIGKVVAAETFGLIDGLILDDAGLSGRGGRLIRSVSRLGALGSYSGLAESAIILLFIVISENVQSRISQS